MKEVIQKVLEYQAQYEKYEQAVEEDGYLEEEDVRDLLEAYGEVLSITRAFIAVTAQQKRDEQEELE